MEREVDLTVIGAGPAGLEASVAAAQVGLEVLLVDSSPEMGGQYFKRNLSNPKKGNHARIRRHRDQLLETIVALGVKTQMNSLVWGAYPLDDGGWRMAVSGMNNLDAIRSRSVIIATGAYDFPLPFPGWTLPGVMTAGAAQLLIKQGVLPGKRILISGSGPLQLALTAGLIEAGGKPVAVLETARPNPAWLRHAPTIGGQWSRLQEGLEYISSVLLAGVPFQRGWCVTAALGQEVLEAVEIARLDRQGHPLPGSQRTISVDTLVIGFGQIPNNGLARLLGCRGRYANLQSGFVIERDEDLQSSQAGVFVAGDAACSGGAQLARLEGTLAGLSAARYLDCIPLTQYERQVEKLTPKLLAHRRFAAALADLFAPVDTLFRLAQPDTIICRCEEITLAEIRQAVAAGATSPDEVKLLSRSGMGNCQGRICENYLVELLRQETLTSPGEFTVRPPLHPLPVEKLAGYTRYT